MNATLTHRFEFHKTTRPTIAELERICALARADGFDGDTLVHIDAGTDPRDHDYSFHAAIGTEPKPVAEEGE